MTAPIESLIEVGVDILSTVRSAAGTILVALGDVINQRQEDDGAQHYQHVGFASRASTPTAGKAAAQAVVVRRSDRDVVIATTDARTQAMYGSLEAGETAIFAGGTDGKAQGRMLLKADGSLNLYTRVGNTDSGAGMAIQVTPATNSVSIVQGTGHAIIVDPNGITLTTGAAALVLGHDGSIKLIGTGNLHIDGKGIDIGNPTDPVTRAALRGPSGLSGTPSPKVRIE